MSLKKLVVLLLASTVSACQSPAPPAPPAPAAPPTPAGLDRLSLMERLGREASIRAPVRSSPEAMAAALSARGLPLERWKQVLASPIGARFCMAGQTAAGNVVAVCEFGDAAAAEAGLAYSRHTFDRLIPNRTLVRRDSTVLTLTRAASSAAVIDEANTVTAIFAAL